MRKSSRPVIARVVAGAQAVRFPLIGRNGPMGDSLFFQPVYVASAEPTDETRRPVRAVNAAASAPSATRGL